MTGFRTVLLDLDDTLYPSGNGLWELISRRIDLYLVRRLELPEEQGRALRARYASNYGTTLAGLMDDYAIDPQDYLSFVHDIPVEAVVQPDPNLRTMLADLPQRRVVFTNASQSHAERVLARLGASDRIDLIVSIERLGFINKPEAEAYRRALSLAEEPSPARCLIADDRLRNLAPAAAMGMTTVLVGDDSADSGYRPDYTIERVTQLAEAIPGLAQPGSRGSHAG